MTIPKRIWPRKFLWLVAPLAATLALSGCPNKKEAEAARKANETTGTSAEPDKVLYERALGDIQHNRYDEARLSLQTLINTYPDSEYLAKAKLATADSYYKQGGPTALTQAIAQYQDFITFFPFLDEAAYAQMQIAMSHYKRMEKPDRDRAEALEAEGAFQTFLQKYPTSPLYKDAQQRLREVQEVLAQGDYAVARFYYLRQADRASAARLYDLVNRYPLFSEADRANWMLASIAQRGEHNDIAGQFYARIVKDYPLSPLAGQAKDQLVKLGQPVPQADPAATARMQAEQNIPRPKERGGIFRLPEEMLRSAPDVRMAARVGTPTMTPEGSTATGDTLTPGGGNMNVGIAGASNASGASRGAGSTGTGVVETVVPGSAAVPASSTTSGTTAGVAAATTPAPDATATVASPDDSGATTGSDVPTVAAPGDSGATTGTDVPTAAPATPAAPAANAAASGDPASSGSPASATSTATSTAAPSGTSSTTAQNTNQTSSAQKESTSKKKKGLKRLIPF